MHVEVPLLAQLLADAHQVEFVRKAEAAAMWQARAEFPRLIRCVHLKHNDYLGIQVNAAEAGALFYVVDHEPLGGVIHV